MTLGVAAPTDRAIVIIIWGQSNAVGPGTTLAGVPSYLTATYPNLYIWNYDHSPQRWEYLNLGYNNNFDAQLIYPNFAVEMNMGYQLMQLTKRSVYLIKYAVDGTSMANFWKPSLSSLGFDNLKTHITDALTALATSGIVYDLKAMYSMQGESDATNSTDAGNYQTNREAFNSSIKTFLGIPTLQDVFGRISSQIDGTFFSFKNTVRAGQAAFQATDPSNRYMIDTDAYPMQSETVVTHYTGVGQVTQGLDAFNIMKTIYT